MILYVVTDYRVVVEVTVVCIVKLVKSWCLVNAIINVTDKTTTNILLNESDQNISAVYLNSQTVDDVEKDLSYLPCSVTLTDQTDVNSKSIDYSEIDDFSSAKNGKSNFKQFMRVTLNNRNDTNLIQFLN